MIELPYPVSTNRYWRNFNGRMVISPEGKAYKHSAGFIAKAAGYKPVDGNIEITIILHPRKNKDGSASKSRVDLDNALKVFCDSMNGVAYHDDSQIVRIIAEVGSCKIDGGLTVEIKQVK